MASLGLELVPKSLCRHRRAVGARSLTVSLALLLTTGSTSLGHKISLEPKIECGHKSTTDPLLLVYLDVSGSLKSIEPTPMNKRCFTLKPELNNFLSILLAPAKREDPAALAPSLREELSKAIQDNTVQLFAFAENLIGITQVPEVDNSSDFCLSLVDIERIGQGSIIRNPLEHASNVANVCKNSFVLAVLVSDLVNYPGQLDSNGQERIPDFDGRQNFQMVTVLDQTDFNQPPGREHATYSRENIVGLLRDSLPGRVNFAYLPGLQNEDLPQANWATASGMALKIKSMKKLLASLSINESINGWIVTLPSNQTLEIISLASDNPSPKIKLNLQEIEPTETPTQKSIFAATSNCEIFRYSKNPMLVFEKTDSMAFVKHIGLLPTLLCSGRMILEDRNPFKLNYDYHFRLDVFQPREDSEIAPFSIKELKTQAKAMQTLPIAEFKLPSTEEINGFMSCERRGEISPWDAGRLLSASAVGVHVPTKNYNPNGTYLYVSESDRSGAFWRYLLLFLIVMDVLRRVVFQRKYFLIFLGIGISLAPVLASQHFGIMKTIFMKPDLSFSFMVFMIVCFFVVFVNFFRRKAEIVYQARSKGGMMNGCLMLAIATLSCLLWLVACGFVIYGIGKHLTYPENDWNLKTSSTEELDLKCAMK